MAQVTLKYIGHSAVIQVGHELVKRGGSISLDDELAEGLLAQGCSFPAALDGDGKPTLDGDGNVVTEQIEVDPQWKKTSAKKPAPGGGGNDE